MISRQILRRDDFRFELKPCDFSCVPGLHEAMEESRAEVSSWMGWLHPDYNRQNVENWIAYAVNSWNSGTAYEFVIRDRQDGAILGCAGLNGISRMDLVANLGYWVRTSRTRLGAATQAALLLRDFGLNVAKLNRLEIVVADGNAASRRVAEKTGALYEGMQRRRMKVFDKVHDAHMYAFV